MSIPVVYGCGHIHLLQCLGEFAAISAATAKGFGTRWDAQHSLKIWNKKFHFGTKRIAKNLQHEKSSKWHTLDTNESVCCSKVLSLTFKCKCHDFLPSFLHRRPFGVQKWLPTKWRTKLAWRPFGVFLASFWRTKKAAWPFAILFLSFGHKTVTKMTAKSRAAFFCPPIWSATKKKDSRKSLRSFWWAKDNHSGKDSKKSWHLRSPLLTKNMKS